MADKIAKRTTAVRAHRHSADSPPNTLTAELDTFGRPEVERWLAKADGDLYAAEVLRAARPHALPSTAGFHAQQAVEKYLKTVLVAQGKEPPWGHGITKLWEKAPEIPRVLGIQLTHFAALDRYPALDDAASDEPAWDEVDAAIRTARGIKRAVRRFLDGASKSQVSGG